MDNRQPKRLTTNMGLKAKGEAPKVIDYQSLMTEHRLPFHAMNDYHQTITGTELKVKGVDLLHYKRAGSFQLLRRVKAVNAQILADAQLD